MLMSSRPMVISRGRSFGSTSNTVRRPSGSRLVVTTPAGLWNRNSRVRSIGGISTPSSSMRVGRADVEGRRGQLDAVDLDPAVGDQRLGVAARGDAGARQPLGDALARAPRPPRRKAAASAEASRLRSSAILRRTACLHDAAARGALGGMRARAPVHHHVRDGRAAGRRPNVPVCERLVAVRTRRASRKPCRAAGSRRRSARLTNGLRASRLKPSGFEPPDALKSRCRRSPAPRSPVCKRLWPAAPKPPACRRRSA